MKNNLFKDLKLIKKKVSLKKKKSYTTRNQIIITENDDRFLNFYNSNVTNHDFIMLKDSNIIDGLNEVSINGKFDSEYQVVQKLLTNLSIPFKKSKYHELAL